MSLRERQIREVLDEDLRARKEVVRRQFKQAQLMNETYTPPNRFEKKIAFAIDKYFLELQKSADIAVNSVATQENVEESPSLNVEALRDLLSIYNELILYLDSYASYNPLNQRDIAVIENKFDAIQPVISNLAERADGSRGVNSLLANQLYAMDENIINRNYSTVNGVKDRNLVQKSLLRQGVTAPEMLGIWSEAQGRPSSEVPVSLLRYNEDPQYVSLEGQFDFPEGFEDYGQEEQETRTPQRTPAVYPTTPASTRLEVPRTPAGAKQYISSIPKSEIYDICLFNRKNNPNPPLKDIGDAYLAYKEGLGRRGGEQLPVWLRNKQSYIARIFILREQGVSTDAEGNISAMPATATTAGENTDFEPPVDAPAINNQAEGLATLEELGNYEQFQRMMGQETRNPPRSQFYPTPEQTPVPEYAMPQAWSQYGEEPTYAPLGNFDLPEDYEEPTPMGNGRRRRRHMKSQMSFYGGQGESEDMMYGLPYGYKKGMFLRPMDRRPVHFKTRDERGERGLSLEDRMTFLNQLDTRPIKQDLEINSIHTYKKAMDMKLKKMKKS